MSTVKKGKAVEKARYKQYHVAALDTKTNLQVISDGLSQLLPYFQLLFCIYLNTKSNFGIVKEYL